MGEFVLEVKAVDRDLDYSDRPAAVSLRIHPARERLQWMAALGVALALCLWQTVRVPQRHHRRRRDEEDRLREVRDLQMALMPEERCDLEGFDIMGRCVPSREVGGNLFAFLLRANKRVVALADVEGTGVAAAVAVRTLDGVLRHEMLRVRPLDQALDSLSTTLSSSLDRPACLLLSQIDSPSRTLRLVDAGCPSPCLFRAAAGEVMDVQPHCGPLAASVRATARVVAIPLAPGVRVLLHSRG